METPSWSEDSSVHPQLSPEHHQSAGTVQSNELYPVLASGVTPGVSCSGGVAWDSTHPVTISRADPMGSLGGLGTFYLRKGLLSPSLIDLYHVTQALAV